jgi:hypothetical protein
MNARLESHRGHLDADEPSVAATAYTRLFQQTLKKRLKGQRIAGDGVSPDEAVPIVKQIAEAFEAARQHSDASPQCVDQTGSFSGVGRHVHDPDVAVVLSPGEIQITTIGRKMISEVPSPSFELCKSRDLSVV